MVEFAKHFTSSHFAVSKKETEDKIVIKGFKDGSSSWWVGYKHYCLDENNALQFVCGGIEDRKETEAIQEFIKRNKKSFKNRELSILETEEKEYSIITFGKMSGKTTQIIVEEDKRYARWLYDSVTDNKIKTELKELLKIK